MSYWTYLKIDAGGEEPATVYEAGNMTSNVSGIWADAMGKPLRDWEGTTGADLALVLDIAISKMKDPANAARYKAMEPSNGWGSLEKATEYLETILEGCREYPKAHLHVSG